MLRTKDLDRTLLFPVETYKNCLQIRVALLFPLRDIE